MSSAPPRNVLQARRAEDAARGDRPHWLAELSGLDVDVSVLPVRVRRRPHGWVAPLFVAMGLMTMVLPVWDEIRWPAIASPAGFRRFIDGNWDTALIAFGFGLLFVAAGLLIASMRYSIELTPPYVALHWSWWGRRRGGFREPLRRYDRVLLRTVTLRRDTDSGPRVLWVVELGHPRADRSLPLFQGVDEAAARARLAQAATRFRLPSHDETTGRRSDRPRTAPSPGGFDDGRSVPGELSWETGSDGVVAHLARGRYGYPHAVGVLVAMAIFVAFVVFGLGGDLEFLAYASWVFAPVGLIVAYYLAAAHARYSVHAGPAGLELRTRWPWGRTSRTLLAAAEISAIEVGLDKEADKGAVAIVAGNRTRHVGHRLSRSALEQLRDGLRAALGR